MSDQPLNVVLLWHMHQPNYYDPNSENYILPWTYLHATKDYTDMAWHLEQVDGAKAVVNFAPTLLEQLDDYAQQIQAFLSDRIPLSDPLLSALSTAELPTDKQLRQELIEACLKANEERLIHPVAEFSRQVELINQLKAEPNSLDYLSDQFLTDLLVSYHLAWMGETIRRDDARIKALIEKAHHYSLADRRALLSVIGEQIASIIPRYRRLAEQGKIEISMTPYAHPIMPLLLDIKSAHQAAPSMPLPELSHYPDGAERVDYHIKLGFEVFEKFFGFRPVGCWPSEGSISNATLEALEKAGYQWAATGQTVLANSLNAAHAHMDGENRWLHQAYHLQTAPALRCFFRDDGLSDAIGFRFSKWHADDAVNDFVRNLENIANNHRNDPKAVTSVILDGENAWEYYPQNAFYFLQGLYQGIAEHPRLRLTTYQEAIADLGLESNPIEDVVAGSWVYGTFSTWIGDKDKNRAWDMLGDAKKAFDACVAAGKLTGEKRAVAEKQLAICEGSDWCWWFGDYNPSGSVGDFERLYRKHLYHLYHLLEVEAPDYLAEQFSFGGGAPATGGVMRQGQAEG